MLTACSGDSSQEKHTEFSSDGSEYYWKSATYVRLPNAEGIYKAELTPIEGQNWRYTFSGPDVRHFNSNWDTGRISNNGASIREKQLDENTDGIYSVLVGAYNDAGDTTSLLLSIDANATIKLREKGIFLRNKQLKWLSTDEINVNPVGDIDYTLQVAEHDEMPWQYTISGEDAYLFEVDSSSGKLTFKEPLIHWQAWDNDHDQVYKVLLGAINKNGDHTAQLLTIDNSIDGDFRALSASASLMFPPPNSEIGLGETVEMTAIVKVERGERFEHSLAPIINDRDMIPVEGSDDLWQSKIQFAPGNNDLEINFNGEKFKTRITNREIVVSQENPELAAFQGYAEEETLDESGNDTNGKVEIMSENEAKCNLNYFASSTNPISGGGFELDLMRQKLYFMSNWDGYCELDLSTGKQNHTEFSHSTYYPSLVLSASKEDIWIYSTGNYFYRYHAIHGERRDAAVENAFPHRGGFTVDVEMHPNKGNYIALGAMLITGNVLSLTDETTPLDGVLIPEPRDKGYPLGIAVDWESNHAYLGATRSTLYQVDLNSKDVTVLLDGGKGDTSDAPPFSSIVEVSGKSLIVSGEMLGGLFRYHLESGEVESLVENRGAGLSMRAPQKMRGDIDQQVIFLFDEKRFCLFAVSLLSGDRVVLPWSSSALR